MKHFLKITCLLFLSLIISQCTKQNEFLIAKNKVGKLSNENIISDLAVIYSKDSIVKRLSEGDMGSEDTKYMAENDEYLIYSKQGKHLLTIVPKILHDSTSAIKYVEIINSQFKTEKELSLLSPFKDVNTHYMIDKVESSLSSATLFIDELNATIALSKSEIGLDIFDRREIKIEQIPDLAKIKHMTIWFD